MATEVDNKENKPENKPAGLKLPAPFVSIGIDVGKMHDPTTIVVSEASRRFSGRWQHIPEQVDSAGWHEARDIPILETAFAVRFVSRIPLGTDYPVVALMLAHLLDNKPLQGKRRVVRIDITGVGRPIYDMLVAEVKRMPEHKFIQCVPITFTHGDKFNKETGVLGKAFGVSRAQSLIQRQLIKVPNGPSISPEMLAEVLAMLEELKVYKIKVDPNGMDKYGAFETGTHDDLATGLILSVLEDALSNQVTYGPKIR